MSEPGAERYDEVRDREARFDEPGLTEPGLGRPRSDEPRYDDGTTGDLTTSGVDVDRRLDESVDDRSGAGAERVDTDYTGTDRVGTDGDGVVHDHRLVDPDEHVHELPTMGVDVDAALDRAVDENL